MATDQLAKVNPSTDNISVNLRNNREIIFLDSEEALIYPNTRHSPTRNAGVAQPGRAPDLAH